MMDSSGLLADLRRVRWEQLALKPRAYICGFPKAAKIGFFKLIRGKCWPLGLVSSPKRLTLFKRGPGRSPGEILVVLIAFMCHASSPSLSVAMSDSSVEQENSPKAAKLLNTSRFNRCNSAQRAHSRPKKQGDARGFLRSWWICLIL